MLNIFRLTSFCFPHGISLEGEAVSAAGFLTPMAPCDHQYALEALRLAELTTLVMNSVTSAAIRIYQSKL